ncbi:MAG: 3',5'-cyclic-nucleotide phosphodiesterase [Acidobacteriota bacterium]|nr:3',5'-cyclic-nucleotide phosphodiesterase [Acidobacteriota bacterium]
MKIQLLSSTFDEKGCASRRQHLACFVLNDRLAIDAGSLAFAVSDEQRKSIRDIVITHAHLDHIAGLPLFVDDLFSTLEKPLKIYGSEKTIEALERHIFNWEIYPRFSELKNEYGAVMEYVQFSPLEKFNVADLEIVAVPVNHQVETVGFVIAEGEKKIAFSSDTAEIPGFWQFINEQPKLNALFIECAFPNRMSELAAASHHLTPQKLAAELQKLKHSTDVFIINLKPMFREEICEELVALKMQNLKVMLPGEIYEF